MGTLATIGMPIRSMLRSLAFRAPVMVSNVMPKLKNMFGKRAEFISTCPTQKVLFSQMIVKVHFDCKLS